MKIRAKLLNLSAFGIFSILLCGFQTSFLSHLFPGLVLSLWILPLIYIVLYREFTTAIVFVYLAGLCASFFSASSVGSIWLSLLFACSLLSYIKNKVFYDTAKYFLISCGLFVVFLFFASHLMNLIMSRNTSSASILAYLVDALGLMILSFAFFRIFKKIDSWLPYDPFLEQSKGELYL